MSKKKFAPPVPPPPPLARPLSRLTRSDFDVIADVMRDLIGMISNKARRELIDANIEHLQKTNPLFDEEKFREACRY